MADCEIYIPSPASCDECDVFEARLDNMEATLANKQNKLTAGTNIAISGNTISSSYVDTWKLNTRYQEGYVASGNGQANKVWKTDANGVPGWRNDADTTYTPASATPLMDGTGAVGTSAKYAREDHVHPTDTSRNPVISYTNNTSDTYVTVASETNTTITSVSITQTGTYLLIGHCHFETPGTGTRSLFIATSPDGGHVSRYSVVTQLACPGHATHMTLTQMRGISSAETLYLRVWQDSGQNIQVGSIGLQVVKLK